MRSVGAAPRGRPIGRTMLIAQFWRAYKRAATGGRPYKYGLRRLANARQFTQQPPGFQLGVAQLFFNQSTQSTT